MVGSVAILALVFAGIVFLLLGGPLWLARRLPVSKVSSEAPRWLKIVAWLAIRLSGAVLLAIWLATVTGGDAVQAFLLYLSVVLGLFLAVNGHLRLVVHSKTFSRGQRAPPWMESVATFLSRTVGAGAVLTVLLISLWLWSTG